ncbi:MAG: hypothetical protein COA67_10715 [Lutibacter sp.]|nr:MAG: hypothetical protein COA67_10715 [Lutibacter sp.]
MKNNIIFKRIIIILIFISSITIYSQTTTITNLQYQGIPIPDCGSIDLNSSSSHAISFNLKVTRPYFTGGSGNEIHENGTLKVILNGNNGEFTELDTGISGASWTIDISNNQSFISFSPSITLFSSQFPTNGGWLVAEYSSNNTPYRSCYYDITKPKFKLNPTNVTVSCGSTGETFTVSNENNSPGSLSYNWSVGSGWEYQGSAVSNFTTSSNTVILVPTAFPPSNVSVVPKLDGVSYPQLIATVSLAPFSLGNQRITGSSTVCSSRNYSLNGLPSNTTITWSVSNTNLATVTPINATQATVTAVGSGNGVVVLTALVSNACNQTVQLTKSVNIGAPTLNGSLNGDNNPLTGEYKWYSVSAATGATSYEWYFDVGGVQYTSINGWEVDIDQGTSAYIKIGSSNIVLVCKAINSCGDREYYMYVNVRSTTDPCPGDEFRLSSNPMKSGSSTNKVIIIDDPCDDPSPQYKTANKKYTVRIFDEFGNQVYKKQQDDKEFDINELEKGFYVVKYQTKKGEVLTKKLIIQ